MGLLIGFIGLAIPSNARAQISGMCFKCVTQGQNQVCRLVVQDFHTWTDCDVTDGICVPGATSAIRQVSSLPRPLRRSLEGADASLEARPVSR